MTKSHVLIDNVPVGENDIKYLLLTLIFGQPLFFILLIYDLIIGNLTHSQKINIYYGTWINSLISFIVFIKIYNVTSVASSYFIGITMICLTKGYHKSRSINIVHHRGL